MSDIKVTPVVRRREERKERECKEHKLECPVCLAGEGHGPFWPKFPSTYPDIRTIYVRAGGSDKHGDGSARKPFRTFKHAIRFVPPEIPPGHQVVVDVTGIGLEEFPTGYALPNIQSTAFLQTANFKAAPPQPTLPFTVGACLNIRATPQPFSGIPLADTSIPSTDYTLSTVPGASGLTLLTLTSGARASWAGNALQGALLISDAFAVTSCAIYGSDATHLFITNIPSSIVGNLSIVEPSATFQTPTADSDGAGFECVGSTSLAIQGISFTTQDGTLALGVFDVATPALELCFIQGLFLAANLEGVDLFSSVVTNGINFQAGNCTPFNCLFLNLGVTGQAVFFGEEDFLSSENVFINTQGSLGPSSVFTVGGSTGGVWEFQNTLIQGSVAPNGAIYAHGGGGYAIENTEIDGSSNDAVFVDGPLDVQLINVGGTGNGGVGVHATNGAQVRVDATTTVTGTNDVQSGSLAPTSYASLPQYDLPPNAASLAVATGARIFLS